jgi:hypothetical protein
VDIIAGYYNYDRLNTSGYTTLNNNMTFLSSLNISGRTMIGNDKNNYSDSSLKVHKNKMIRNSTTSGSRIDIQVGLGSGRSRIDIQELMHGLMQIRKIKN